MRYSSLQHIQNRNISWPLKLNNCIYEKKCISSNDAIDDRISILNNY